MKGRREESLLSRREKLKKCGQEQCEKSPEARQGKMVARWLKEDRGKLEGPKVAEGDQEERTMEVKVRRKSQKTRKRKVKEGKR